MRGAAAGEGSGRKEARLQASGLPGSEAWLGGEDSNLDQRIQSPLSCRWTTPEREERLGGHSMRARACAGRCYWTASRRRWWAGTAAGN